MTVATRNPLVEDYLRALQRATQPLPRHERNELVEQIRAHLDEALPPNASETDVRNALDALGTPTEVARSAGVPATPRRGAREVIGLLLAATGFPPFLGWIVGGVLIATSPLWSARQKLLGMFVGPVAWAGIVTLGVVHSTSADPSCHRTGANSAACHTALLSTSGGAAWLSITIFVVLFAIPFVTAAYLWRAAGRRAGVNALA